MFQNVPKFSKFSNFKILNFKISKSILKSAVLPASLMPFIIKCSVPQHNLSTVHCLSETSNLINLNQIEDDLMSKQSLPVSLPSMQFHVMLVWKPNETSKPQCIEPTTPNIAIFSYQRSTAIYLTLPLGSKSWFLLMIGHLMKSWALKPSKTCIFRTLSQTCPGWRSRLKSSKVLVNLFWIPKPVRWMGGVCC